LDNTSSIEYTSNERGNTMNVALQAKIYPHVGSDAEIAAGKPIIIGTRITVRCIAAYYQMGMSADEILTTLSHLTPSQIHSALAYYFDHQEEVDTDLAESSDVEFWKSQIVPHLIRKP
jgi:uncharacterized protein (DUF433 family)